MAAALDDKSEYQYLNLVSMFRNILPNLDARFHTINGLDQNRLFALYGALGYSYNFNHSARRLYNAIEHQSAIRLQFVRRTNCNLRWPSMS